MLDAQSILLQYGARKLKKPVTTKPAHPTTVNKVRKVLLTDTSKYFTGREISVGCGVGMTEINKCINQLKLAHEVDMIKIPGKVTKPARAIRIKL